MFAERQQFFEAYLGTRRTNQWPNYIWDIDDTNSLSEAAMWFLNETHRFDLFLDREICYICFKDKSEIIYNINGKCDSCGSISFASMKSILNGE